MDQIPDVVELNVRGRHLITLLSVLTKDEDSVLAAMFNGRLPVCKDKDGRYFIDANPEAFEVILQFLRDGFLPDIDEITLGGGGFENAQFGLGGFSAFGNAYHTFCESDIRALYREAKYFGIKHLVKQLEKLKPVLFEQRLEDYRKDKKAYNDCLTKILAAITGEKILHDVGIIIQLRQESAMIKDPKCCQHQCIEDTTPSFGFGQTDTAWETDVVVNIPVELDVALFKMLFTDLQKMGYNIQGRLAVCHFRCNKKSKKSGKAFDGTGSYPDICCCMEKLYLIKFALGPSHKHATGFSFGHAGAFGSNAMQQCLIQTSPLFGQEVARQQEQQPPRALSFDNSSSIDCIDTQRKAFRTRRR